MKSKEDKWVIYQTESGSIEFRDDIDRGTVWANLDQIAKLFGRDKSVISRHIRNIFKAEELDKNSVVAKNATTASDNKVYQVTFYNLDLILSVGYRVNSKTATKFRKWATQILKQHIVQGYSLNKKRIEENKAQFLETLEDLKLLSSHTTIEAKDVLSLIQSFSDTWFNLEQFDKGSFPKITNQTEVDFKAEELENDLQKLKEALVRKGEATSLFAQEKREGSLKGIFNSVFQTVFGVDAYDGIEEKAAHLLYFIVKNHPFNDGNKRSAAFSFIWFLHKSKLDFRESISPQTLTTLTILIAQSPPADKDKMIGIISLLLNKQ